MAYVTYLSQVVYDLSTICYSKNQWMLIKTKIFTCKKTHSQQDIMLLKASIINSCTKINQSVFSDITKNIHIINGPLQTLCITENTPGYSYTKNQQEFFEVLLNLCPTKDVLHNTNNTVYHSTNIAQTSHQNIH